MEYKSDWRLTLEYINKQVDIFTPLDIRSSINDCGTINTYINYLRQYEYIERVGHGKYIKVKDIPTNITINSLKSIIYHPMFQRAKKIRNIKNRISENNI